jgi:hypothetical protein
MARPSKQNAGSDPGQRIARKLDQEKVRLVEENTRLQRALHLLLAVWPVGTDARLWEQ